ncbi:MAG: cytochrome c maturation protein CcmE [Gemmatimonadota bacterium]
MRHGRFYVGLVSVALVVTYLVWTGVSDSMVYYLTPTELVAKVAENPDFHTVGVKVSGKVVSGTYSRGQGELIHLFTVHDIEHTEVAFPVVYEGVLPDTFTDEIEVVLEGRFGEDGVFQAKTLLTKCGSRYEAAPEELAKRGVAG